jgi:aspartate kinase
MKVMKFGGSCLRQAKDFKKVTEIIREEKRPRIIVVSAIHGTTALIDDHLRSGATEEARIPELLEELKDLHSKVIIEAVEDDDEKGKLITSVERRTKKLERVLYGVCYTEELTGRTKDLILSFGERLSAPILAACLRDKGLTALAFDTDRTGLITDSEFGNATAHLPSVQSEFSKTMLPKIMDGVIPVLTGYFGSDPEGRVTTFGKGGSDYSAAVVAYAVDAEVLEIWKDVAGFMSADPKMVAGARTIERLSYLEAAELAYFGAKVLHPRSVEPVMGKRIPIQVKSMERPLDPGTLILGKGYETSQAIKSVAYSTDVAVLKVHGAGVGHKPGVLNDITGTVGEEGVNIRSVITSQTCISLLLDKEDIDRVYRALEKRGLPVVDMLEPVKDIALVGIVGEGIVSTKGLAARAFSAVASSGVNVEMISAGASTVAYYFIVKEKDLGRTVKAVHSEFFPA